MSRNSKMNATPRTHNFFFYCHIAHLYPLLSIWINDETKSLRGSFSRLMDSPHKRVKRFKKKETSPTLEVTGINNNTWHTRDRLETRNNFFYTNKIGKVILSFITYTFCFFFLLKSLIIYIQFFFPYKIQTFSLDFVYLFLLLYNSSGSC